MNRFALFFFVIFGLLAFGYLRSVGETREPQRTVYVGDAACEPCHTDKFRVFETTAHHFTSRSAGKESIAGHFQPGSNILKTSNPNLLFQMDAKETGFFQNAVEASTPGTIVESERFDFVIGSGRKGQTYLYWKGDLLFELPVSYWTELDQWVNSPGYRDGFADFSRRVPPRCLECHATYFASAPPPPNRYKTSEFTLGIACEKCHGTGAKHIAQHTSHRDQRPVSAQDAIINPAKLSRDRQVDLCALCHAGPGEPALAPAFSFKPGDKIDDFFEMEPLDPNAHIDVHGNQVELLKKSRCFRMSKSMTCSTCHDVHVMQRDAASFSAHCLSCHKPENCGLYASRGAEIARNCVDCHMPNESTDLIVSDANGRRVRPKVRNHWIKVYTQSEAQQQ
ncbi:MAG TPA: multiheme c-type cytochrome [Terriglobales bacterium]|nr:multiheme c-type cytochrome [Terriglobales bacterium]